MTSTPASASVIVGVSGGIASYKSAELVRGLRRAGLTVRCALSENAARFVQPLLFATLSGNPTLDDVWSMAQDGRVGHVEHGHAAQLIILAPATANLIAKLHAGLADDAITTLVLSSRCPVLIAPAMESDMWAQAVTQRNVANLRALGRFHFVGPETGALASGATGVGRMAEPDSIFWHAQRLLTPQHLANKRVIVTAGPTREALDPIRYLSNRSSGKMGFAIAHAAALMGASVTLIHGPVALQPSPLVQADAIESATELLAALEARVDSADVLVMAAAVADYAPNAQAPRKLKKHELGATPAIALRENPDVLQTLSSRPGKRPFTVGFAAETHDVEANALAKLSKKGLDLIVANDVSQPGIGMDSDDNRVAIYDGNGLVTTSETRPKREVAELILHTLRARL